MACPISFLQSHRGASAAAQRPLSGHMCPAWARVASHALTRSHGPAGTRSPLGRGGDDGLFSKHSSHFLLRDLQGTNHSLNETPASVDSRRVASAKLLTFPLSLCPPWRTKLCDKVQLDSIVNNELSDPEALLSSPFAATEDLVGWKDVPGFVRLLPPSSRRLKLVTRGAPRVPRLKLLNLRYDLTPIKFVDSVVTEVGMIPPTAVPVLLREYRSARLGTLGREVVGRTRQVLCSGAPRAQQAVHLTTRGVAPSRREVGGPETPDGS